MKRLIVLAVAIAATLLNARAAVLGTYTWKGGNGNWSDKTMWEGGVVPPATDTRNPNDYYEIYLRPLSNTHYVINLDQETVYKNTHLKVQTLSGIVNATITLSGGKMEFRQANGPGVNNCGYIGVNLQFTDCEIVLPGFNPFGGTITFGDGAKITSSMNCYFSVANSTVVVEDGADITFAAVDTRENIKGSKFVVNGGKVTSAVLGTDYGYGDFLYQFNGGEFTSTGGVAARGDAVTTIEVNGGKVRLPAINFKNSESILRISGGELLAPKPINAARASISLVGGCYNVDPSDLAEFMKVADLDYIPKGPNAVLDLHYNRTTYAPTWTAMLTSNTDNTNDYPDYRTNLLFSGTMQMTNTTLAAFYTRGGDAIPRIGKRGKLLFPAVFTRQKGEVGFNQVTEFDLDLFALSSGLHAATPYLTYDFLNGVTIGAFLRDWTSDGYVSDAAGTVTYSCGGPTLRFNDALTVDTSDQLDKVTPRTIRLVKTTLNNVTNMTVKGGGRLWMCTTADVPYVGALDVKAGSTFEFAGKIKGDASPAGTPQPGSLWVDGRLVLENGSTLALQAGKVAVTAQEGVMDGDATVAIDLPDQPAAGTITRVVNVMNGECQAKTVLTGAGATADWQVKSLAGFVYLTDNTTPDVTGHDSEWYWTGAAGNKLSVAGNWTKNDTPVSGSDFKPRFTGTRNMEIVNDLESWSCFNLYFTEECGPVSLSGNPLTLVPQGYGGETAAIYSASPYPVEINLDLTRNAKFGIINNGDGRIRLNGRVNCGTQTAAPSRQYFIIKGSVQIGGSAEAGALLLFPNVKSTTQLTILDGGVLTLAEGDATLAENESEQATVGTPVWVCQGGRLEVGACFNTGKCPVTLRVDGTFDCAALAQSAQNLKMTGSGTVNLGGAYPSDKDSNNAKRVISAGGTLTLRMSGNWDTITSAKADHPQTLAVNGDVKIVSDGNWRYGHDASVVTTTSAADRAITIASGAKLTFAGGEGTAVLAEPIVGPGTLDFDPTANIEPGGMLASAEWTTIADVGEVVKLPTMAEYKYRVVDGGENGKLLQAKGKPGIMIIVR